MSYQFLRKLARTIVHAANGKLDVRHRNLVPKGNYVLIAPHRTWLDIVMLALAASPKEFGFLAKKELYRHWLLKYFLNHAHGVPVDRQHPGPSVIIKPVNILTQTHLSIMIFPSGTRHSEKAKSGAALIAKLAKVPLEPAVYQGPLTFKDLLTSEHTAHVAFGKPIYLRPKFKLNAAGQKYINQKMQTALKRLDNSINPHYHYSDSYLNRK